MKRPVLATSIAIKSASRCCNNSSKLIKKNEWSGCAGLPWARCRWVWRWVMHRLPSCSVGRSRRHCWWRGRWEGPWSPGSSGCAWRGRIWRQSGSCGCLSCWAPWRWVPVYPGARSTASASDLQENRNQFASTFRLSAPDIPKKTALTSNNFDWRNRLLLQINSDRKITKIDCGQTLIWIDSGSNVRWRTNELPNDMHMNKFRSLNYSDLTRQVSKTRVYSIEHFWFCALRQEDPWKVEENTENFVR